MPGGYYSGADGDWKEQGWGSQRYKGLCRCPTPAPTPAPSQKCVGDGQWSGRYRDEDCELDKKRDNCIRRDCSRLGGHYCMHKCMHAFNDQVMIVFNMHTPKRWKMARNGESLLQVAFLPSIDVIAVDILTTQHKTHCPQHPLSSSCQCCRNVC